MNHDRRYIVWLGKYRHGVQGWWVRFTGKAQMTQRTFLVSRYGTKMKALRAAQRWRDQMIKRNPELIGRTGYRRTHARNKGMVGVTRDRYQKILASGKVRFYWGWHAKWIDPISGGQEHKYFSEIKYGKRTAERLAKIERQRAIIHIERELLWTKKRQSARSAKRRARVA